MEAEEEPQPHFGAECAAPGCASCARIAAGPLSPVPAHLSFGMLSPTECIFSPSRRADGAAAASAILCPKRLIDLPEFSNLLEDAAAEAGAGFCEEDGPCEVIEVDGVPVRGVLRGTKSRLQGSQRVFPALLPRRARHSSSQNMLTDPPVACASVPLGPLRRAAGVQGALQPLPAPPRRGHAPRAEPRGAHRRLCGAHERRVVARGPCRGESRGASRGGRAPRVAVPGRSERSERSGHRCGGSPLRRLRLRSAPLRVRVRQGGC